MKNTVKNLLLCALVSGTLLLSGCAMLDGLMMKQKVEDGKPLYIDDKGTPDKADDELTFDPGTAEKPNKAAYEGSSGFMEGIGQLLSFIPGVGQIAIAATALVGGGYASVRGYKGFQSARAAKAGKAVLLAVFAEIQADWLADKFDKDGDGVVSLAEAGEYFKEKGLSMLSHEGLNKILSILSNAMLDEPMKAKALDKLAGEM